MILLDTNVVSEAMKPEPHPSVTGPTPRRLRACFSPASVTTTELLFGIGALPYDLTRFPKHWNLSSRELPDWDWTNRSASVPKCHLTLP